MMKKIKQALSLVLAMVLSLMMAMPVYAAGITVKTSASSIETYVGSTRVLPVVYLYDGDTELSNEEANKNIVWTSDNTSVVTTGDGNLTARAAGTATLTGKFTYDGDSYSAKVSVNVAKLNQKALTATLTNSKLKMGEANQIKVSGGSGTGRVTYTSSNTKVATVTAAGVATFVGSGKVTFTVKKAADATYNAKSTTLTVSFSGSKQSQSALKVSATTTLIVGESTTLKVTGGNGSGKLTYEPASSKIIKVSSAGKVTAKKAGKSSITITKAASGNYSKATTSITINVIATAKVKGVKATAGKKKMTVKWSKAKRATGYQIAYRVKGTKTWKYKKTTKKKLTIKKLKSRKTYEVKVRGYYGKKSITYGPYSSTVTVKVK